MINNPIPCQTILQENKDKIKVINRGIINSAVERPNQIVLRAFPLDWSKNLEMAVEAV